MASYRVVSNANGLPYEVIYNEHDLNRPQCEVLETLLHEMVHLYQENTPGLAPCKDGYHNAQAVLICEEIGLHPPPGKWRPPQTGRRSVRAAYSPPRRQATRLRGRRAVGSQAEMVVGRRYGREAGELHAYEVRLRLPAAQELHPDREKRPPGQVSGLRHHLQGGDGGEQAAAFAFFLV